MTFLQLQNDVLSDRFDSSKLPDVKNWINYRYGRLWASEDWTFKYSVTTASVALGGATIPLTTIQRPIALWDTSTLSTLYEPMPSRRPETFYDDATTVSGIPARFTVANGVIVLNQPVSKATTFQLFGELAFIPLAGDTDIPLIPSEFHLLLSLGAQAYGLRKQNDPFWQDFENAYQEGVQDLKNGYLVNVRTFGGYQPSWPPAY